MRNTHLAELGRKVSAIRHACSRLGSLSCTPASIDLIGRARSVSDSSDKP